MSFINRELIKKVAKKLDSDVKLKGIGEVIDGVLFKAILNILNDKFADKIPVHFQDEVLGLLEAYAFNDYSKITNQTVEVLNNLIDIPELNDEDEGILIGSIMTAIIKIIMNKRRS